MENLICDWKINNEREMQDVELVEAVAGCAAAVA